MSTDHESRPTEEQPAAGETVAAPSPLGPVSLGERISSIDVLRGFALLGILMINKDLFAYSSSVIHDPTVQGGFEGLDFAIWRVGYVFFQMKFMALFSMLFGAGLILMWQRAGEDNPSFRGTYYRRLGWLLLFGLLHAYVLWYGDILFSYAVCGMVVYLFRRKKARTQIILGLIVVLFSLVPMFGMGAMMSWMQTTAESAQTAIDEGRTPTDLEASMLEAWNETKVGFSPPPEKIAEETEAMRSDFWTIFTHQAPTTIQMQTFVMLLFVFWRVAGLMLIGMGLMKLGVLAAQRSTGFYVWCMVIGYGIGLPISWYGSEQMVASDFSVVASYTGANY
jgi:uncharacterized protein